MSFVKTEDIRGFRFDSEIVCIECLNEYDMEDLRQYNIITSAKVKPTQGCFYCDRCHKRLPP